MLWAGPVTVTMAEDTTGVTLVMGRTKSLRVTIVQDKGTHGKLLNTLTDTLSSQVEIYKVLKPDTTEQNGRQQIVQDIIIQAFDSGMYKLPPMRYVVGADTVLSNTAALKVLPVEVDTTGGITPFKPVMTLPFRFSDLLPLWLRRYWWLVVLGALMAAVAIYAYFKWWRKGINPFKPEKKLLPPYEEATLALRMLKNEQLWQNGQEKEYYTRLTDILRRYLDRRFGVNAQEMTTRQILKRLREDNVIGIDRSELQQVLELADYVKFAALRTEAHDCETAFERVQRFVEITRPMQQEENSEKAGKPNIGTKPNKK